MMSDSNGATFGIFNKLQEVQRASKGGGKAVSLTIVKDIEWAHEGVETKCKKANLSDQNRDMRVELMKTRAAESRMRGLLEASKCQAAAVNAQLADAELALEKLADESFRIEANHRASVVAV